MLVSGNPPLSRHARSGSLNSLTDANGLPVSESAPSLLSVSPPSTFHRSLHAAAPSLPDLTEGKVVAAAVQENGVIHKPEEDEEEKCWGRKEIWEWYDSLPWLSGMNYLPRSAVNFVEMWDESTFDPETINEELKWAAEKLGYNTLRTNIPMVLYEHDAEGLTKRINKFLRIAARNGFVVMLCPLDDCEFSGKEAKPGIQPEPVPGLHNSQAIGSPGRRIVLDKSQWFRVEEYVRYMVRTWGHDKRVLLLDLYNEPGNPWIFQKGGTSVIPETNQFEENALQLMEKVFEWAREENPSMPLTTSAWHMPDPFFDSSIAPLSHKIDQRAMDLSDVISIHAYCDPACLQSTLNEITSFGKPILLTEWMARQVKSTYETTLPTLRELKVGAYQWGLVKGKSQTWLPWPHVAHHYEGDPTWWHDVLDVDGSFHDEKEGEVIRSFVYPQNKAISSSVLLLDNESSENVEAMAMMASSHHLLQLQQDTVDIPTISEGEEAVIPSVCSISMAAINAVAATAAVEQSEKDNVLGHAQSIPTFGAQMVSETVEGLDLELGGIEF